MLPARKLLQKNTLRKKSVHSSTCAGKTSTFTGRTARMMVRKRVMSELGLFDQRPIARKFPNGHGRMYTMYKPTNTKVKVSNGTRKAIRKRIAEIRRKEN